ncbi:MAG: glycosyltransferase [Cohaesibacter sp.]|jgi:glycosyltransferase|nr:glycosyltransferase [Cohaesibacter sp.]
MKISIISATFNREETIKSSIASLQNQSYGDYEHIIQDGGSSDGTLDIIRSLSDERTFLLSEKDAGIYDALNKALLRASGDVVGLLHSDDIFASDQVLEQVAKAFEDPDVDAVYGDLQYVSKDDTERVIRNWVSGTFSREKLAKGWMPPHPALFLRRSLIDDLGAYDTSFQIAADYDTILRYFSQPDFKAIYIPHVFVKMRVGGESNRSVGRILRKSYEDYLALKANGIGGLYALFFKNFSKIGQFF